MCNLYSVTKSQDAVRQLFKVERDSSGNLPAMPAVFPDNEAPVIRVSDGARELIKMRWGMPNPPQFPGITTNIRNVASPHWRRWLKPKDPAYVTRYRCLVPVTSFSEYDDTPNPKSLRSSDGSKHPMAGKKDIVWFALNESRPLFALAGIWTEWEGARGTKKHPLVGKHLVFGFLTAEPNEIVKPIHAKAMPVMLTKSDEFDAWLNAPIDEALKLQRPLSAAEMVVVGRGSDKQDAA